MLGSVAVFVGGCWIVYLTGYDTGKDCLNWMSQIVISNFEAPRASIET